MKSPKEIAFQQRIRFHKLNYLNSFKDERKKAPDKNYFLARFKTDTLRKRESDLGMIVHFSSAVAYRNDQWSLKGIKTAEAIAAYCKINKMKYTLLIDLIAENDAIALVYTAINKTYKSPTAVSDERQLKPEFSLNKKIISKIDFIRIFNTLSEMRGFVKADGTYPTKEDVMRLFGQIVGINLEKYAKDLNKGYNASLENNIEVFIKMEQKAKSLYANKI